MGSLKKLNLKAFDVVGLSNFEAILNCNKSFYCFSNKSCFLLLFKSKICFCFCSRNQLSLLVMDCCVK